VGAAAVICALGFLAACAGSEVAEPTPETSVTSPASTGPVEAPETTTTSTTITTTNTTTTTTTLPEPVIDTVPPTTIDGEPAAETTEAEPSSELPVPTNTVFDPESPEGEVEQGLLANLGAFAECLRQLPDCDAGAATRFASLGYADGNRRLIEGWNEEGLESRDVDTWDYVIERVEFLDPPVEAIAYVCASDATRLIKPASETSAEEDVIALDESARSKYLLLRVGDQWVVTGAENIEVIDGRPDGFCQ